MVFLFMNIIHHSEQVPQSFEAENAVIAGLLADNNLYATIDFLQHMHFYDPLNQRIFKYITELIDRGSLANKVTIWPVFMGDKDLIERGGEEYFITLSNSLLSIAHINDYAKQILELYMRREAIKVLTKSLSKCYTFSPNENATDFIESTEAELFNLFKSTQTNIESQEFHKLLKGVINSAQEARKSENKMTGTPTGFIDLDRHLGGFHKTDLIILAGRPSMGKTSLATTMGFNAAKMWNVPVGLFSLEMSAEQLAMRILGQEALIPPDKIRRGMLNSDEMDILVQEEKRLANVPFFIVDAPSLKISGIRAHSRRLIKEQNVGMIIIDYLQLITGAGRAENRVQELSEITRALKALAKELKIPIIALSQLSRAVEQREEKRPQLADLRESGTIEQDADVVMFIYRESYYEARKKPSEGSDKMKAWQERMHKIHNTAELILAKNRLGAIKNITLHYEDFLAKFGNHMDAVNFY